MFDDNRKFWKTVKQLFSDKIQASSKITLLENGVLVTDDKEVAEVFNEYFVNITDSLGIIQPKGALTPTDGLYDPVEITSKTYSSHPSIKLISANTIPSNDFAFSCVTNESVSAKLQELKKRKPLLSAASQVIS